MLKRIFLFLISLIILLLIIITVKTVLFQSKQTSGEGSRRVFAIDTLAVKHLSEAISFRTISFDDDSTVDVTESIVPAWIVPVIPYSEVFENFASYLKVTYPSTFKNLNSEIINHKSILLHWKGSDAKIKPAILYAHLDVVPADENSGWEHKPFNGDVDKDFIYGRGAIDDKGSVIAILESVEKLIKSGFTPARDIYLAFGHDEEAGGEKGAKQIADYLEKKGVHAAFLLDEGGLVAIDMVPFVKRPVAMVFTSEKGYLTLELKVNSSGGHSSFPSQDTPIEILSKAISRIHDHPFPNRMTESVNDFMDFAGPEMKLPFKALFANRWLFEKVIFNEYQKIPSASAMIRTTSVATVIHGGNKENVVPSEVSAKLNFRLLPGDNSINVIDAIGKIINDERILVSVVGKIEEPSKVSSKDSENFKRIRNSIEKVFPDAIVAPSLMIAQTDSRHFRKVTDDIFRFIPVRMNDKILDTMHGTGEKIGVTEFMESIEFYKTLLMEL